MKKILAALLVLALVVPAMADVAITSSFDNTSKNLTISFDPTAGASVRGIALTVTVAGADVDAYVSSSFNTFVDYAFSTPGYTIGTGNPLALESTAGVAALPITSGTAFAVSVGYLDQTGAQLGLNTAGTVAVLHLANIAPAGGTVTVAANATRGGAAVGDTLGTVTVTGTTIPPQIVDTITGPAVVTKTTAAPAIATRVNGSRVETFSVSGVTGSSAVEYQFTFGDGTTSAWSTATTATKTYTYAAATTYSVTVQARLVSNPAMSITSAALALTSEPVKSTASFYATWAAWNRPNCWAFQRNCRGDANNAATGLGLNRQWVNAADLTILSSGFNKVEAQLALVTNGICADNNHLATGLGVNRQWVNAADLTVLSTYFNKTEVNVPVCANTNFWYWTTSY